MTAEELYDKEFGSADNIPKESAIRLLRHFATALKLEREKYNKDLHEFAEWCNVGEWFYYKPDDVWMKHSEASITRIYGTCKMRERWELETGRR